MPKAKWTLGPKERKRLLQRLDQADEAMRTLRGVIAEMGNALSTGRARPGESASRVPTLEHYARLMDPAASSPIIAELLKNCRLPRWRKFNRGKPVKPRKR